MLTKRSDNIDKEAVVPRRGTIHISDKKRPGIYPGHIKTLKQIL
jgi:hypothetical protein